MAASEAAWTRVVELCCDVFFVLLLKKKQSERSLALLKYVPPRTRPTSPLEYLLDAY